jgi:hypothetical protein
VRTYAARVLEIQTEPGGRVSAWIGCPPAAVPAAGQYVLAYAPNDPLAALGTPLFRGPAAGLGDTAAGGFLAAPPLPAAWVPGTSLVLRGPLGRGFSLNSQRLALAALGDTVTRLLPLAEETIQRGDAVTLFTDAPLPVLPVSIEVYPLGSLPEALSWADALAVDLPLEALAGLRNCLGLHKNELLPFPAQALVFTPMPCGGLAECGACAVSVRRSMGHSRYLLACKDGPVFKLDDLEW